MFLDPQQLSSDVHNKSIKCHSRLGFYFLCSDNACVTLIWPSWSTGCKEPIIYLSWHTSVASLWFCLGQPVYMHQMCRVILRKKSFWNVYAKWDNNCHFYSSVVHLELSALSSFFTGNSAIESYSLLLLLLLLLFCALRRGKKLAS